MSRRGRKPRPEGRFEVKAFLSEEERAAFDVAFARSTFRSRSRYIAAACMEWASTVLSFHGRMSEPMPAEGLRVKGRRSVSAYLDPDETRRWALAVERSRMGSGLRAAHAALLRKMAAGEHPAQADVDRRRWSLVRSG